MKLHNLSRVVPRGALAVLMLVGLSLVAPVEDIRGAVRDGGMAAPPTTLVEGRVLEPNGGPIAAALVTFTSDVGSVRSTRTGGDGTFRLQRPGDRGLGGTLRVERLGYRTAEERVEGGTGQVELILQPEPLPLPGFQVLVDGPICPNDDDAAARAVWHRMSMRHPGGLDTMGVASYTLALADTLIEGASALILEDSNGLVPGQRGSAPLLRLSWGRRVLGGGYAFPVRRTDAEGSFDSWSYAPLEADFSTHFASLEFGRLSHFQIAAQGPEGVVLRFCSRDMGRPGLEGRLEISPDTLLTRAEWRFRTEDPDEEAGGWARFSSHLVSAPPPLLPLESMTWRTIRGGGVQRRAQWYEEWVLAPGDSVPFLPNREWDGIPPWDSEY